MVGLARKAAKAMVLPAGLVTRRRPGDVAILLYHRLGEGGAEIEMPTGAFERQLAHVVRKDHPITLDDALDGAGGIVITVDDGYLDFYEQLLPLLVRYRVPAVLYLATGLVANGNGSAPEGLTWDHLREIVASGLVTVGSHTHSHIDLARASEREAEDEMRRSKDLIEDRLGVECRHFAYPFAVASAPAERAARRIFDSAALAWSTNRRGRLDPYRLGRLPVLRSDGQWLFRAKTAGLLDGEAYLYRALRRGPWRAPESR
ncbi:MAG TPA: polysaccharide deacetylase family protein [Actinomycetota bacterium]